jgi:hypothetical protein
MDYYDKALEIIKALADDIHMGEVYNADRIGFIFYTNELNLAIEFIEALRCLRNYKCRKT